MKKIVFKKGITAIHFPITAEFRGESEKAIKKLYSTYVIPKHTKIIFKRELCFKKGLEYDTTEVIIEK